MFIFILAICLQSPATESATVADPHAAARTLIAEYERHVVPLQIETARRWWDANVGGSDEAFARKETAENQLNRALSDADVFRQIKAVREMRPTDQVVARQIELLYLLYLEKQVDPGLLARMTSKANAIEKAFNVYRAEVDDQRLSDSDVRRILRESTDSAYRRRVWEASKGVGPEVIEDLRDLVRLRNEAARKLGFRNFHVMQLALNEQEQDDVLRLFDELDALTREPYRQAKAAIDRELARRYGIEAATLRPWHYHDPFFQEPPAVYGYDLDAAYADVDIAAVCRNFYSGIGLPIGDVIDRSDLYEKPGKSPHAFCTDIDRRGDVRVLANIVPNAYWAGTMLHELGHAVYSSKYIPESLPYLLRAESHILTTEGVAMMFERFGKSAQWLKQMGVEVDDPAVFDRAARGMRRDQLLIFSRWCQVMLRFEVALYDNPGQDLNKLWWDLVEKYQLISRPESRDAPDFASKIHIVSAPCYYHNYMMGELFACQLHRALVQKILPQAGEPGAGGRTSTDPATAVYVNNPLVGVFLREKVFGPGRLLEWNALTEHATGEPLNARAFAAEFQKQP